MDSRRTPMNWFWVCPAAGDQPLTSASSSTWKHCLPVKTELKITLAFPLAIAPSRLYLLVFPTVKTDLA